MAWRTRPMAWRTRPMAWRTRPMAWRTRPSFRHLFRILRVSQDPEEALRAALMGRHRALRTRNA
jgi:hypothetical protein